MSTFRECILEIKPYTPGKPIEEVERELGIKDVIKMASNENPLGPSKKAVARIRELASKVQMYPDGNNYYLKQALKDFLGVGTENLIIGNGSDEIIKLLAETYINPGDEVIMANPSFSEYLFATQLMGGKMIMVPLDDTMTHDLDAMLAAVTEKTKMIFICNPNNPTGTMVNKTQIDKFLAALPGHIVVVLDEAYAEYVENQDYPDSIQYVKEGKNVVVLRTFSKIYGLAGLRIGYGVARQDIINLIARTKEPFNVNSVAQGAALVSLEDQHHVQASFQVNSKGKQYLYNQFKKLKLNYVPTEANFIFVDIGMDCKAAFQELMKKGVIVRTGDIFGKPTYIRVTIGRPKENQKFIKVLKEVLNN